MGARIRGTVPFWGRVALFALGYVCCAFAGSAVAMGRPGFVTFWLPSGLFVAVLLRNNRRDWPPFVAASFAANLAFDLLTGHTAAQSVLFWAGNAMTALAGAWLARRPSGDYPTLSSVREVAGLLLGAAVISTTVSATVGSAVLTLQGATPGFWQTWLVWWSSSAVGVLLLAPLVLVVARPLPWPPEWPRVNPGESLVFTLTLGATVLYVFRDDWHGGAQVHHFLVPVIVWAAFRFGVGGTAVTNAVIGVGATWSAALGVYQLRPADAAPGVQVAALLSLVVVYSATGLFLAAMVAERRRADHALRGAHGRLAAIFDGARDAILIAHAETGVLLDANQPAADLLGRPKHELIGLHQTALHPPELKQEYARHFREHASHPGSPNLAAVACPADGRRVPIEISTNRITLEDGSPALVGVFRDVTERTRIQRVMEARLRLLEFAGTHSLDQLLVATLDQVEALTDSHVGFFHFLDADEQTLSIQAWSTRTLGTMCKAEGQRRHYDVAEAGVWVDCVRQRRAVIHNDYAGLSHRKGLPDGHAPVIRELVVPVFRGNRIVAILGTGNKLTDYTDDDVQTVTQLADLAWDIAERKRAEEALRITGDRLARAQHGANVGLWDWNLVTGRLDWSPELFRMFGLDPATAQASFDTWYAVLHPDDIQAAGERITRAIETRSVLENEYRVVHPSGEVRWISAPGRATYAGDGTPVSMAGLCLDITARRRMEESLRASEASLRSLFDAFTESVFMVDPNGVILAANRTFAERLGTTVDACLDRPVWDVMPPEVAERRRNWMHDLPESGGSLVMEDQRDGRWFSSSLCPVHGIDGRIDRLVVVATDITQRKRAEERLRHSQSELQAIYDHAPVMMCVLNGAREVQYANRAFESLLRGEAEPAEAVRLGGVLGCLTSTEDPGGCGAGPACDACPLRRALADTLESGASHTSVEYRGALGTGRDVREVTLLASTAAIRSTADAPLLLLCLVDITESKRAEAALADSRAELQALSRRLVAVQEESRRDLARELHDRVGQNLTALNLNFTIMQGALPREALDLVRQRLDDSLLLIAESMTHVRDVMAELRPPLLEEYGLSTALHWYVTQMERRTGLRLPIDADEGGPRPPAAVETVFFRVAQEAITNAARHARAREVRVALRPAGAGLCLAIADDGVGADPDAIRGSAGMGLTLMRERAESVGARLAMTAVAGEGTTVELSWTPSPGGAAAAPEPG